MYNIIGADGKQYGPVSMDQLRSWVAQGRINARTQVQALGTTDWRPVAEVAELAELFSATAGAAPGSPPPILKAPTAKDKRQGMAVISFVLGLCSFALCLSAITGIPAIILGHVARKRVAKAPNQYGGTGFATAGIVLGYVSILFSLVIAALMLSQASRAPTRRAQIPIRTDCQNNLRQIGLAFKVWALERNDQYPFNVSTNAGGSLELCSRGADGFENNPAPHFLVISNELSTTAFLVCPDDKTRHVAASFESLRAENVSFRLRTGTNINSDNPQEILAVCPIHGNVLYCDGNVRKKPKP
jgi:prepilin-type processing-associated H-X9-DG protein